MNESLKVENRKLLKLAKSEKKKEKQVTTNMMGPLQNI